MNTVLFVNATIGFSENLFLVLKITCKMILTNDESSKDNNNLGTFQTLLMETVRCLKVQ